MPNAAKFTSMDGYSVTYPLDWLYAHGAVLAERVGGEPLSESFGGTNQLWISGAAARLFVRDVVSIEFLDVENIEPPSFEADGMLFQNRPNASIGLAPTIGAETGIGAPADAPRPAKVGEEVTFEGWAYDFDRRIEAIEFSLDLGASWTRYLTPGTDPSRWVRWSFSYTPVQEGSYEMWVRAVSEDGTVGPVASKYEFGVTR